MPQSMTYILNVGKKGSDSLNLQHKIFKYNSYAQLEQAGLKEQMVVWDIGCGNGVMTEYLAQKVGNNGLVYALDTSPEQIEIAKKRIALGNYTNVRFITSNILNIQADQYEKADIVYSRFLLMHVQSPEKVIQFMASLLKSDGVLSLHESSFNSITESQNVPSIIQEYYKLLIAYGHLKECDYNIGGKLPEICSALNLFSTIKSTATHYKTTKDIKTLLSIRLDELQAKLVSSTLITSEEYKILKNGVRHFLNSEQSQDSVIISEQTHVLACCL